MMQVIKNLITCRWYQILNSQGFTFQGKQIDASTAFRLLEKHYDVRYRDISVRDIFDSVYEIDMKNKEYYQVCGYIEDRDLFVNLKYTDTNTSQHCCICLCPLNEDFPVRIYGAKCFHDIHLKCLNELERKSYFPCCSGRYDFTSHTNITHIYLSQLKANPFTKHSFHWKDIDKTENNLIIPENILDFLTFRFPTFVKFCSIPYNHTVRSYHPKWSIKNKIVPI